MRGWKALSQFLSVRYLFIYYLFLFIFNFFFGTYDLSFLFPLLPFSLFPLVTNCCQKAYRMSCFSSRKKNCSPGSSLFLPSLPFPFLSPSPFPFLFAHLRFRKDVKTENMMLPSTADDPFEAAKLIDFGFARPVRFYKYIILFYLFYFFVSLIIH